MPSYATMVGFMFTPFDEADATSAGLARRLDMPICAVPSMIAEMPVVEPSAAMSKVVPGCSRLKLLGKLRDEFCPERIGALDDEAIGPDLSAEQTKPGG